MNNLLRIHTGFHQLAELIKFHLHQEYWMDKLLAKCKFVFLLSGLYFSSFPRRKIHTLSVCIEQIGLISDANCKLIYEFMAEGTPLKPRLVSEGLRRVFAEYRMRIGANIFLRDPRRLA